MSAWWAVGATLLLLGETLLALHCWQHHRATTRDRPIYCLGLHPINPRTGSCRHRDCIACQHSRAVGAELRAAHPEIFSEGQP